MDEQMTLNERMAQSYDFAEDNEIMVTITLREYRDLLTIRAFYDLANGAAVDVDGE